MDLPTLKNILVLSLQLVSPVGVMEEEPMQPASPHRWGYDARGFPLPDPGGTYTPMQPSLYDLPPPKSAARYDPYTGAMVMDERGQIVSPIDSDASHHEERPLWTGQKIEGERRAPVNEKAEAAALVDEEENPDITQDMTDDSDEEARQGGAVVRKDKNAKLAEMAKLAKSVKVGKKEATHAPKTKKPRKEKDIAVTTIPQISENLDELAEWIRGYEFLYNLGHKNHQDLKKKMILYNQKANDMMEGEPGFGRGDW